jgi:hemolysin activation/secretion protein
LLFSGAYNKFWKLSKLFYLGTYWSGKFSAVRDQPYYYQRGLGYGSNFVRGYELYVIDGQSYGLIKNTLKFNLLPTKTVRVKFLKTEKFNKIHYALYLNWFLDVGYVDNYRNSNVNPLNNDLLVGTGFGLDLVTYYDIVLRLEASMNKEKEVGFFIHIANAF